VRWVAENLRPFEIVNDRAFIALIKTGRPDYQLPSSTTLARDVHNVFLNAKARMAKYLQVSKHLHVLSKILTLYPRAMLVL
jgi:hypothetical protein